MWWGGRRIVWRRGRGWHRGHEGEEGASGAREGRRRDDGVGRAGLRGEGLFQRCR